MVATTYGQFPLGDDYAMDIRVDYATYTNIDQLPVCIAVVWMAGIFTQHDKLI